MNYLTELLSQKAREYQAKIANLHLLENDEYPSSQIIFSSDPGTWVMKITRNEGIQFNRESYPFSKADDFAKAVIDILEKSYCVKFEKSEPPYDL